MGYFDWGTLWDQDWFVISCNFYCELVNRLAKNLPSLWWWVVTDEMRRLKHKRLSGNEADSRMWCVCWLHSYDDSWFGHHRAPLLPPPMRGARFNRPPYPTASGHSGYRSSGEWASEWFACWSDVCYSLSAKQHLVSPSWCSDTVCVCVCRQRVSSVQIGLRLLRQLQPAWWLCSVWTFLHSNEQRSWRSR